jgi:O-antigen biosynthesis protein WbqP
VKRAFDVVMALAMAVVLALPMLIIAAAVKLTSKGPILYWSDRVGQDSILFSMPKFRSMRIDAPALPTHLLTDAPAYLTPVGGFLRRASLDEFPQLWSIIRGDMSFVGPRPALFNQDDLMELRRKAGVDRLRPGLTGWAQVNGRDELSISDKVALEADYLARRSFLFDLYILWLTVLKVVRASGISH